VLEHRIENFCEYVTSRLFGHVLHLLMISRAIIIQLNQAEELLDNPLWIRAGQSTKDADTILKVFRDISSLCEVFQVSFSDY